MKLDQSSYGHYAYIRVSTKDQNEARQLEAMKDLEIMDRDFFIDKQSGKNFDSGIHVTTLI